MPSEFIERVVFTLAEAYEHRAALKKVLKDPAQNIKTIFDIDPRALYEQGLRCVVFDFDGVLAPQHHLVLSEKSIEKMAAFCEVFGRDHIVIWSNNPIPSRMQFVHDHFKGVTWLDGEQKPYPDCLKKLVCDKGCQAKEVLMIDDRLLTGVLAGILTGCRVYLVKNPLIQWRGQFKVEFGFVLLRFFERLVFSV